MNAFFISKCRLKPAPILADYIFSPFQLIGFRASCSSQRFLIFCQLWANAATKFQCNPMVLAVLSFSADTPFVTTRLRLWPHQFSHDHSNFLTAATISAQLSVVMHASFLSMNPHSLNEQRRDSDKLSSVWPSGKKLGLQTPALQLSFCIYDMHGQTHKWSHIKVGPHIRSGGK